MTNQRGEVEMLSIHSAILTPINNRQNYTDASRGIMLMMYLFLNQQLIIFHKKYRIVSYSNVKILNHQIKSTITI